tara:strand:+ start:166367 stop:166897 length:531 start_codon:yes stop_codon:yes gene_type:complete
MDNEYESITSPARMSEDQLVPKDFFDILFNRYLPVASLTYLGSLIGYATKFGGLTGWIGQLARNPDIYMLSLYGAIWVSIPAMVWILMRSTAMMNCHADIWYKVTAGMMAATLILSLILFPMENGLLGMAQNFIVAVLPVHILMYILFVKGGMPVMYGAPISTTAIAFLIYGMFLL